MITTLLLQTILASNPNAALSTSRGQGLNTLVSTTVPSAAAVVETTSSANDENNAIVQISLENLQKTATAAAKKAAEEFRESLKGQSWGNILFGSPKRIAATIANGTLLGYSVAGPLIQFGFIENDSSPLSLSNITLSNAQNKFNGWSDAGKGIAISAFATGVAGLITSATQYCLTKGNDLKALQSEPFAIESQTAAGAAKDPFDSVAKVVVGTGDDEMTMTLAAFKKRSDFSTTNPFANVYSVILTSGDKVEISEEGIRMDQAPSN